jgi:hypothetical protein
MLPLNARELTDLQWAILDALIPEPSRRKDGRGRPWKDRIRPENSSRTLNGNQIDLTKSLTFPI